MGNAASSAIKCLNNTICTIKKQIQTIIQRLLSQVLMFKPQVEKTKKRLKLYFDEVTRNLVLMIANVYKTIDNLKFKAYSTLGWKTMNKNKTENKIQNESTYESPFQLEEIGSDSKNIEDIFSDNKQNQVFAELQKLLE